jgi:3-dehydroshikimate dehydratase
MAWMLSAFADEAGDACQMQIDALLEAKLRRVDLRSIDGFNITVMPPTHARLVKNRLDAAGIAVAMFGSPIGKIDIADDVSIDLQKLRHLATLAPIFNCTAVRIFSYYNRHDKSHDEWRDASLGRLAQLKLLANQLGLVLYHENERHIFGDRGADVQTIARTLRDPNGPFRMIFDFDNYHQSGDDVWANWAALRESTDAIHLKDSARVGEGFQHVPAGQGGGKIKEILADAVARGWSGPVTIEPHLSHSGAVMATGPSGVANEAYRDMPPADSFHAAADAAVGLLKDVGASWV